MLQSSDRDNLLVRPTTLRKTGLKESVKSAVIALKMTTSSSSSVDKWIFQCIIDDGSSVNVMPESTKKKLGLSNTHPSYCTIRNADQRSCKPIGRIKGVRVGARNTYYILNFEVIPRKDNASSVEGSYQLLLGHSFL